MSENTINMQNISKKIGKAIILDQESYKTKKNELEWENTNPVRSFRLSVAAVPER